MQNIHLCEPEAISDNKLSCGLSFLMFRQNLSFSQCTGQVPSTQEVLQLKQSLPVNLSVFLEYCLFLKVIQEKLSSFQKPFPHSSDFIKVTFYLSLVVGHDMLSR